MEIQQPSHDRQTKLRVIGRNSVAVLLRQDPGEDEEDDEDEGERKEDDDEDTNDDGYSE